MDKIALGRTDLSVSVMGLGCGGHSRLGMANGGSEENAVAVVRRALDLGVNFIDTAEAYGTETAVGKAIAGVPRDSVVISTKVGPRTKEGRETAAGFKERAKAGLKRLQTDYVDILHVHGVSAADYPFVADELLPALKDLQDEGAVRFTGITEAFGSDTKHAMLDIAVPDNHWDVIMVGFNLLNPSARKRILPAAQERNIGVLDMFAVRRALHDFNALRDLMKKLVADGLVDAAQFDGSDPLHFLTRPGVADSIPEAAYRFCRYEPGIHVTLSGTGSVAHLEENAASLSRPPLPPDTLERLQTLFGHVDTVSGN